MHLYHGKTAINDSKLLGLKKSLGRWAQAELLSLLLEAVPAHGSINDPGCCHQQMRDGWEMGTQGESLEGTQNEVSQ